MVEGKKCRGDGRVSFLAHLDKFKTEIEKGWSLQTVYERFSEKLDISYPQFVKYARRYITGPAIEPPPSKANLEKTFPASNPITRPKPKTRLNDPMPLPDSELF